MPSPTYNQNGTPTPVTVATAINSASSSTGVSPQLLTAVAQQESTYGQNPSSLVPNSANAVGVMQLTPIALKQLSQSGYDVNPYDVNSSTAGAAILFNQNLQRFNGDQNAAIAAYFEGPTAVASLMAQYGADWEAHLPPAGAMYLASVNQKLGNGDISANNPTVPLNGPRINTTPAPNDPTPDPITAMPLPYQTVTDSQLQAITPLSIVDVPGLNNQPWYTDPNMVTGNPRLQKMGFPQGFPIVFEVYMDQTNSNSLLSTSPVGNTSLIGSLVNPAVMIPLNCSLTTFKVASKHIVNKEPTRTGFHLTMWGMAADVIEGSGSTGVFMNQYGLTDFLSLKDINSDAVQAVLGAYSHSPTGVNVTEVGLPTGNPVQPATTLNTQVAKYNAAQIASNGGVSGGSQQNYVEPFRIAAEDAFQEFLALFKMNGTTWLHPSGYSFDSDNNNAPDIANNANNTNALSVFSTGVGASDVEIKARNNDVYKRGFVVMKFRNSQYLGFFKSLNWVMDAEKPYQWKFNFVFQVERTLSLVYYPTPTATPAATAAAMPVSGSANAAPPTITSVSATIAGVSTGPPQVTVVP